MISLRKYFWSFPDFHTKRIWNSQFQECHKMHLFAWHTNSNIFLFSLLIWTEAPLASTFIKYKLLPILKMACGISVKQIAASTYWTMFNEHTCCCFVSEWETVKVIFMSMKYLLIWSCQWPWSIKCCASTWRFWSFQECNAKSAQM